MRAHTPDQVEVGDIVRIPHFVGARNKQHFMYRLAVPIDKFAKVSKYKCELADINEMHERGKDGFRHSLDTVSWCEILHTNYPREVPRKKEVEK